MIDMAVKNMIPFYKKGEYMDQLIKEKKHTEQRQWQASKQIKSITLNLIIGTIAGITANLITVQILDYIGVIKMTLSSTFYWFIGGIIVILLFLAGWFIKSISETEMKEKQKHAEQENERHDELIRTIKGL